MVGVKREPQREPRPKYNMWQNSAFMIGIAWRRQKSVLGLCIALAALTVASGLLTLFVTPAVLGVLQEGKSLQKLLLTILGFVAALAAVGAATNYVNTNTLYGRIAVRIQLVMAINEKNETTSYPNTEDHGMQKLLEKAHTAVNSNYEAGEAIWNTLTGVVQNVAGFIIYLALLSALDPLIVAITLATTVTGYFITKRINEWGYRHREEEAEYSRRMNYVSQKAEDYTLAKDIRMFGMQGWLRDVYAGALNLYQAFVTRGEKVYIWGNAVEIVLTLARNGIAYAYLIGMTLRDGLPAPQFLLYFTAVSGFTAWVGGILSELSTLHRQSLDIANVREFLEAPEPFRFEDGEPLEPDRNGLYEFELRDVSFRYPGADKDTLRHINLRIQAGEKLAVVGLNGAGKTTLIKLLCGFYDPTQGTVLLNGSDIRKYNRRDYYRHFSAVFQQTSKLAATMAENVAQTDTGIDMDRVRASVEKAGLRDKLESLPRQYDAHLGKEVYEDGVELSGGETLRLMLARALYKDAPVVVLDEPTAALDPLAESDVYSRYNDLTGGRTSVYISHRLASTRFCDRIILIADGEIIEEGTHAELLRQGGRYAGLFEVQSRYYAEGGADDEQAE